MNNVTYARGTWESEENCINAAKKCKSFSEFRVKYAGAYDSCHRNKWLDNIVKILPRKKEYRTCEDCEKAAKNYEYIIDFLKSDALTYNFCIKNFKEIVYKHCKRKLRSLSNEDVVALCKKYTTLKELLAQDSTLYRIAISRNLRTEALGHLTKGLNITLKVVYILKSATHAYIGISCNPQKRYSAHLDDSEKKIITDNLHEYKMLTRLIPENEAAKIERKFIKYYRKKTDYILINKSNGGELGGNRKLIYGEEEILDAVSKCESLKDFYTSQSPVYSYLKKNGLLSKYLSSLKRYTPVSKYTEDIILSIVSKYEKFSDFYDENKPLYAHIKKNKLEEKYLSHLKRKIKIKYWNFDTILEAAKLCSSYNEFMKKHSRAYFLMKKNGWKPYVMEIFNNRSQTEISK